ncbi:MAG: membrane protein, partial [Algoriphagus marincola HL-49]
MKRTSFILILIALLSLLSALILNPSILADFLDVDSIGPVRGGIGVLIAGAAGALVYLLVHSVKRNSGEMDRYLIYI